jgi:transposase
MEASRLFCVGIATVYRWVRQKKEKGHVASQKRKYAYKKLKDNELRKYVETHPEAIAKSSKILHKQWTRLFYQYKFKMLYL